MAQLAATQYGLVSAGQMRGMGYSDEHRRHLLAYKVIRGVRRSVYAMAGVPPCWEQAILAAVLAAGPGVVVSHATAGAVWELKHCPRHLPDGDGDADVIHLTASRHVRIAGVVGHRRCVAGECRRERGRIPVTGPERTIMDLTSTLTEAQLGECVDDALRRGLIRLERLRGMVDAVRGPGRRTYCAHCGGCWPTASSATTRAPTGGSCNWTAAGMHPACRQLSANTGSSPTAGGTGWTGPFPDLQIGIEWNGFATHGTRSGFDRDSRKRADLTAAGWHMLDFTSRTPPELVFQAVMAAVEQREKVWLPEQQQAPESPRPR